MKKSHAHRIEQRPFESAEHRTDQLGARSSAEPLGASKPKCTFNGVQGVTSSTGSIAQVAPFAVARLPAMRQ